MLYAWVGDQKRAPLAKGERTTCRDCGGLLTAVVPVENTPHWRHKAGDCDPWSEPEGPWHLGWKELFDISCREIALRDPMSGELHRADVLVGSGTPRATVLELQHSSISEDERNTREAFYRRGHRMFWLVHIHSESSFLGTYFSMSRLRIARRQSRRQGIRGHALDGTEQTVHREVEARKRPRLLQCRSLHLLPRRSGRRLSVGRPFPAW